jgi:signal transduction histidine kinase
LARFLVGCLVALILVFLATMVVARNVAKTAALHDAGARGGTFGRAAAASLINSAVRRGEHEQLAKLDYVMRSRLLDGSIVHIKMWSSDGVVIWSDERGMRGRKFDMDHEVSDLFGTERVTAGMTNLAKDENEKEAGQGPLFEVYAGAFDADGEPVVLESYWSTDAVESDRTAIVRRVAPLALGSLLLFQLALLPLAMSLVRRVDRGRTERAMMLRHALSASELERRRIAQDLHDGVIQDLSGLGYVLPAVYAQLPETERGNAARDVLQKIGKVVEKDVSALRSLLTDLYPERLAEHGLQPAVEGLAQTARDTGVEVDVDVERIADEQIEVTQLAYRIIREGLRNVVHHAQATRSRVLADRSGNLVVVSVADDGIGVSPDWSTQPGHLGLRLLADFLHDVGGTLELAPGVDVGTVLTATFPAQLLSP